MLEWRLSDLNGRQKRVLKRALVAVAERAELNLSISEDTLWDALDEVGASDEAEEQLKRSGILRPKGRGLEFLHATFQEWSLARAFQLNSSLLDEIGAHWQQPNYEETLALLWSMTTAKDRLAATKFLLNAGCQNQLNEQGEAQGNRKRSGIRTALHLWHRSGVAVEPESLEELINVIQDSHSPDRRQYAVEKDANTPTELLKPRSSFSPQRLAGNPNTSEAVLLELIKLELPEDFDESVRLEVAHNPNATEAILIELTKDESSRVRSGVARNPNVTERVLLELMRDRGTHSAVAHSPNTTEAVLLECMKDRGLHVAVADNPNATEAMLLALISDPFAYSWAIYNPSATEVVLRAFIKNGNMEERFKVPRNPNLTEAMLHELIDDEDVAMRSEVAGNPNVTEAMLLELAKDENWHVRWKVSQNPDATEAMLLELIKDENGSVRREVAKHPNITEKVLLEFIKDADPTKDVDRDVYWTFAENPEACLEWL